MQTAHAKPHLFGATAFIGEAAVGVFELPMHLGGCTGEGYFDVSGLVGGDEGSKAFRAGFEDTAFIFPAGFFAVFVAQVDVYAGEVRVEPLQELVDVGSDGIGEFGVHRDRAIAVDLNLHGHSFTAAI
jgi:hypothetical protein